MPLVRGRYPVTNQLWSALGQPTMSAQSSIAQRTNLVTFGANALADAAAALTTQVCTAVAIPVEVGDLVSKVSILVGATPAGAPTDAWAAIYSGTAIPGLLGQSVDIGAAAIGASALFTFTLAAPIAITSVNAPTGFIYASIMSKATVVPSCGSVSIAAAVGYKWFANGPLGFCVAHGSALVATAPATITAATAQTVVPIVFLS